MINTPANSPATAPAEPLDSSLLMFGLNYGLEYDGWVDRNCFIHLSPKPSGVPLHSYPLDQRAPDYLERTDAPAAVHSAVRAAIAPLLEEASVLAAHWLDCLRVELIDAPTAGLEPLSFGFLFSVNLSGQPSPYGRFAARISLTWKWSQGFKILRSHEIEPGGASKTDVPPDCATREPWASALALWDEEWDDSRAAFLARAAGAIKETQAALAGQP